MGKGQLAEFDVTKSNLFYAWPEDLVLVTDPEHPLFDERVHREPSEAFVRSVDRSGVRITLGVRREGEQLVVAHGRKRVKAARIANERREARGEIRMRVPFKLENLEDGEAVALMVLENEHREEDTPVNWARKAQRMRDLGQSEEAIAAALGVEVPALRALSQLLEAAPEVIAAVEKGEVPAAAAAKLSKVDRKRQIAALAEMRSTGATKGAKAAAAVAKATGRKLTGSRPVKEAKARLADAEFFARMSLQKREGWLEAVRWCFRLAAPVDGNAARNAYNDSVDEATS